MDAPARLRGCFSDTGGTFTDTFLVDEGGGFVVAKAPTTPDDLAAGYFDSIDRAARLRDLDPRECLRQLETIGYASTTVINTVLTHTGPRLGLITTRGFRHLLLMQRGVQSYTDFDLSDRLHARTHRLVEPLIDQEDVLEVTERVDCLGDVMIPLYRQECRRAAEELIDRGIDIICVLFLYCWRNPVHERLARDVISTVARERGKHVDVYLSHEVNPVGREFPRLNATVIEAYTHDRVVGALRAIERELADRGFRGGFHLMQSTGGVTTLDSVRVVETLESGPVGGVIGAKYVAAHYGVENFVTTDVGGTSFDVGMVSGGNIEIEQEPVCARMVLGVPMVAINSLGAGGGTIARIDPLTNRLTVGPQSAGAMPGPVCYAQGGKDPTVTDADLVLGYLSPVNFLGGRLQLDVNAARAAIEERIARPLGISVGEAAAGIVEIVDVRMREAIRGTILAQGRQIDDYHLLAYGGAGPTHVAAYSRGLPLKGVLVFPYSSVFCAFGAACADVQRNFTQAANVVCVPGAAPQVKAGLCTELANLWSQLESQARTEAKGWGGEPSALQVERRFRMRYGRQLDQILVTSPVAQPSTAEDWDRIVRAFEARYVGMFTESAMYPQAGYEVVEASVVASLPRVKPVLPRHDPDRATTPSEAQKTIRPCFFAGGWIPTPVYEWSQLRAGTTLTGPAIVEADTQTLVVPPEDSMRIDEYLTVWLAGPGAGSSVASTGGA